ncbi:MAG: NADH:flavin oxidoreductase/NADH oxidase family protein [Burkholderiaceae bacterium]
MLNQALQLPCGAVLENRLAKAALTERLADGRHDPTPALETLYRRWSAGGVALQISGNVLVDRVHLEAAGNMVADAASDLDAFRRLAAAGRSGGNHFWMQINHAGRQTPAPINPRPMAPSAVRAAAKAMNLGDPVAMSEAQILATISAFARAARIAKDTGFTGVQVHGAHGYLVSAFLNPLANQRDDDWGGALEGRARFLMAIIDAVRQDVGPGFPVSVKLNSTDFQAGGFTLDECARVANWLEQAGVDLLEISGGNYEAPAMIVGYLPGEPQVKPSTLAREAYFIDYAVNLRARTTLPLMLTGGFRSAAAMREALEQGATDVIGLGRTLCVEPGLPRRLIADDATALDVQARLKRSHWMPFYYEQIARLGRGEEPDPGADGEACVASTVAREEAQLAAHRESGH